MSIYKQKYFRPLLLFSSTATKKNIESWSTYVSVDELGCHVRLWVLVHDGDEPLALVIAQCDLDVVERGGFNVVQVVGEEDGVLHGVDCTRSTAWEDLKRRKVDEMF